MHKIRILIILLLWSFGQVSHGQMERFRKLSTSDGLPENTGQAIIQDQRGFIWIGTQNGLARYDGFDFKVFQHQSDNDSSLSNNQVECLYEDSRGYLWVATRNGLNRFDPLNEVFERFLPDSSKAFSENWFRYFVQEDANGNIWASTGFGFYCINNWKKQDLEFYASYPTGAGTCIAVNFQEPGILGAVQDSVFVFTDLEKKLHSIAPQPVECLFSSSAGLLAGTNEGVFVFRNGLWQRPDWWESIGKKLVLKIYEDRESTLWILTSLGLYRIDESNVWSWVSEKNNEDGLSHNLCLSILEDREGQYWIGTGQGINILDPRQDQFIRITESSNYGFTLPDPHVEVIRFTDDRNLWIGTANGLLHLEFQENQKLSKLPAGEWPLSSAYIYSSETHPEMKDDNIDYLYSDQKGKLWVGCANGDLYLINEGTDDIKRWEAPHFYKQLRGITRYQDQLWLGYASQLMVLDESDSILRQPAWLPEIKVVQYGWYKDELWVGSPSGIYVVNPGKKQWRVISAGSEPGQLPNTMLTHVYDEDSLLWIASFGGGLYRYDSALDTFRIYTEADGLPNNNIWAVYPDHKGRLWLSTDNGISRFDPLKNQFKNFRRGDGLNFDDFSMSAHDLSPSGEIFFGNPEGITLFDPARIGQREFIPPAMITNLEINYEERTDALHQLWSESGTLKLYPEDKTLTFSMAVLGYASSAENKYAFKLEGYDKTWVTRPAVQRQITYTDLPTGRYTLKLKSANADGLWSETSLAIPVVVIPPYYETWWFRMMIAMMAVILIGSLIYAINRRRYLRKIRVLQVQQQLHGERERISKDLHDHVGAHLTKIITDLDILSLQLEVKPTEANLEQIENTRGFTQNTVRLLRDTIWAINQDEFSIEELADKVENYLDQYLGDFVGWKVTRNIEGSRQLSPNEVMNLLRIIQEATQNMLKYARASFFEIVVKYSDFLEIEISDDGVGFGDQGDQKEHYGLKNMKDRAAEIGARFQLHSTPGKGTIILITK